MCTIVVRLGLTRTCSCIVGMNPAREAFTEYSPGRMLPTENAPF